MSAPPTVLNVLSSRFKVVPVSVVPVSVVGAKEVPNMASVTGTGRKTSCNNYYSIHFAKDESI